MLVCIPPLDCFRNVCPADLPIRAPGIAAHDFDASTRTARVLRGTRCETRVSVRDGDILVSTSDFSTLFRGVDAEQHIWFSSRPRLLAHCIDIEAVHANIPLLQRITPDLYIGVEDPLHTAVYLTGGFHSAVVARLCAEQRVRHAYCAVYADEQVEPARRVANQYGLDLRIVWIDPHIDVHAAVRDAETFHPPTVRRLHALNALAAVAIEDDIQTVFTGEHAEMSWTSKRRLGMHSRGLEVRMPLLRRTLDCDDLRTRFADVEWSHVNPPRKMLQLQRIRAIGFCGQPDSELRISPDGDIYYEEQWLRAIFRRTFGEHLEACVETM